MATGKRSLYDELGVAPGASLAEIRKAHRERVKARHPDHGGSREEFEAAQHAWVVLRDADRRAEYDATGVDPGEAVDLRESQVLGVVAAALGQLMAQPVESILANPVITVMRDYLAQEITSIRKNEHECRKSIAKIERVAKRFRRRGEGENQLAGLMRGQISMLEQSIAKGAEQISLREEARALLADYEFDQELPMWVGQGSASGGANPYGSANASQQGFANAFGKGFFG